jgi:hypothetical protein
MCVRVVNDYCSYFCWCNNIESLVAEQDYEQIRYENFSDSSSEVEAYRLLPNRVPNLPPASEISSDNNSDNSSDNSSDNNSVIVNSYKDHPIERISAPSPNSN